MGLPWQSTEEVEEEYTNWRRVGAYVQAEIDILIWWLKVIVRLLFVLIAYQRRRKVE